jgi:hypothetical protein
MIQTRKANGYVLQHDSKRHILVIATGILEPSENEKTGPMIQIWILRDDMSPVDAVKTGNDSNCLGCQFRGNIPGRSNYDQTKPIVDRGCYVNVGQGPRSVFAGFLRGIYPVLALNEFARIFGGRDIRIGAYGDPALIAEPILARLVALASRHTGYSHAWRKNAWLKPYVMASCDTPADYREATAQGWRTFRVTAALDALPGEILCPASSEAGHRTQCFRCGLCNGAGAAKNIFIPAHGSMRANAEFVVLQ